MSMLPTHWAMVASLDLSGKATKRLPRRSLPRISSCASHSEAKLEQSKGIIGTGPHEKFWAKSWLTFLEGFIFLVYNVLVCHRQEWIWASQRFCPRWSRGISKLYSQNGFACGKMALRVVKGLVGLLNSTKVPYIHFICRKPAFRYRFLENSRIDFQNRVPEVQPVFL